MFDKAYPIREVVKMDIRYHLQKAIERYGLEGTEEKIKELYKH